jgi:serine/threonine protein kinase
VKIRDFGLVKVAPSLGQEIAIKHSHYGLSLLAQSVVFDTLDYASPEQLGLTRYGKLTAKSDVFAFGKTLYRLLTGENPQSLHPRHLAEAPELFELLCDCVEIEPEKRVDVATLISQLTALLSSASQVVRQKPVEKPIPLELYVDKRKWWNQLSDRWKKLFKTTIGIEAEPSDSDLDEIFNLQKLDCSWYQFSDLEPLRELTQLQDLVCSYNEISDLEPLCSLTQLQKLDCASNKIRDLEPLCSLTELRELNCADNPVSFWRQWKFKRVAPPKCQVKFKL